LAKIARTDQAQTKRDILRHLSSIIATCTTNELLVYRFFFFLIEVQQLIASKTKKNSGKQADEETKLSGLKKFLFSSFGTTPAKFLAMERLESLIEENPDLNLWVLSLYLFTLDLLVIICFFQEFVKLNTGCSDDAVETLVRMDIERITALLYHVRRNSTSDVPAVINGNTLRMLAALPAAFNALNITVDERGTCVLPIDVILASKSFGKKLWFWVVFAQLLVAHEHDSICGGESICDVLFAEPSEDDAAQLRANGLWIAATSIPKAQLNRYNATLRNGTVEPNFKTFNPIFVMETTCEHLLDDDNRLKIGDEVKDNNIRVTSVHGSSLRIVHWLLFHTSIPSSNLFFG
jgi:hypothetical protein